MGIEEQVYETLINSLESDHNIPWVIPVFKPEQPCYEYYREMLAAYERLRFRLGEAEEDCDVEIMINSLLEYGRILALEMFRYGRMYQKLVDERNPGV